MIRLFALKNEFSYIFLGIILAFCVVKRFGF